MQGDPIQVPHFIFSSRFCVAVLGFFGLLASETQRLMWPLVLPCMLNETAIALAAEPPNEQTGPGDITVNSSPEPRDEVGGGGYYCDSALLLKLDVIQTKLNFALHQHQEGDLVWPGLQTQVLTDCCYWASILGAVLSGWLAERFGGRLVVGVGVGVVSAASLLTPLATRLHYFPLILLRVLAGLAMGSCIPGMHAVLGKWAPPLERSLLAAFAYSGLIASRILVIPLVSGLCQYGFLGGWPSVFYVLGAYGCLWTLFWLLVVREFPRKYGRLSVNEKRYLHATLVTETILSPRTRLRVPLVSMVTSLPVLAVILSHFAHDWVLSVYLLLLPQYFAEFLKIDYTGNAYFALVPPLGCWLLLLLGGMWTDQLRSRGVMTTAPARKIMNTIGTVLPAAMLAALAFLDCRHWVVAVCLLTAGVVFHGLQWSGWWLSHLDMAPQYAGFLMGISLGAGTLAQRASLELFQHISNQNTREQWQTFLLLSAALLLLAALAYLATGPGNVQSWARVDDDDKYAAMFDISDRLSGSGSESDTESSSYTSCSSPTQSQQRRSYGNKAATRDEGHSNHVFRMAIDEQNLAKFERALARIAAADEMELYNQQQLRAYNTLPWPQAGQHGRAYNIDKYGTLPKTVGTHAWKHRKYSDGNTGVLEDFNDRDRDVSIHRDSTAKRKGNGSRADPPSDEMPSSSTQNRGYKSSSKSSKRKHHTSESVL